MLLLLSRLRYKLLYPLSRYADVFHQAQSAYKDSKSEIGIVASKFEAVLKDYAMRKRLNLSAPPESPRVYVGSPSPMPAIFGSAPRDDSEPKKVKLEPKTYPAIAPSEKVELSIGLLEDVARRCMSGFIMNYKGVTSYEAAWMAIFREAAQLHACIRANPLVNAHLLYGRCLSDLRYEIRTIGDDESPMRAMLEESIPRRSYCISEGPRSDLMRDFAIGYHVVRHPFQRMMIFHPKCVQ